MPLLKSHRKPQPKNRLLLLCHPNTWNQRCKCRHLCHKCPLKCSKCKPIVLAVMTKNKYSAGEYAKAQKYSEWGAWLCILSVVLSILFMPFSMLML